MDHPRFDAAYSDTATIRAWLDGASVNSNKLITELKVWVAWLEHDRAAYLEGKGPR